MDDIIDRKELADRLKMSQETIRQWTYRGRIPCLRLSPKLIRYSWKAIEDWLKKRECKGGYTQKI